MRVKVNEVSVTINADEALSIINAINKGLDSSHHFGKPDKSTQGAVSLLKLLNGSFRNSKDGIHHISER